MDLGFKHNLVQADEARVNLKALNKNQYLIHL